MAWNLHAQALTCEGRGRRPPHLLLAVDAHGRTLPRLRAALNPLPTAFEVDTSSA